MQRKITEARIPAIGRKLAVGRKRMGFIDDGKVHAVLDTNVVIYALEGLYKESHDPIELDSLEIIRLVERGVMAIAYNSALIAEYHKVGQKIILENRGDSTDLTYLINLLTNEPNAYPVRMLVDPQRVSPHPKDDILFDGLASSYLISNNLKHVDPAKLVKPSSYLQTLNPTDFLTKIKIDGII